MSNCQRKVNLPDMRKTQSLPISFLSLSVNTDFVPFFTDPFDLGCE